MSGKPAVFLDRDGILITERGYLTKPENLQLFPDAPKAVSALREAGYAVFVVTNQSAVARGFITEALLTDIHHELERQLSASGARLNGIYTCPHHPEVGPPAYQKRCTCRKPEPGLLLRAATEHNLDLARSFMVGDNLTDLQAGWNAGCQSILVKTGHGTQVHAEATSEILGRIACIAETLSDAANWICTSFTRP
ncbi:MAG: HAD family hydrolase [bacterium]|nr:HAD family hydrolase [bacterium]